jgi:DNA polymerase-3 subunit beta
VVTIGGASAKLAMLPIGDFPMMAPKDDQPLRTVALIDSAAFVHGLSQVAHAISQEETRYYLNGAYVHAPVIEGRRRLVFVATDGHRLARHEAGDAPDGWTDEALLIPRPAVEHIRKFAPKSGDLLLSFYGQKDMADLVRLEADGFSLFTKLIDGSYPDYTRAIPRADDGPRQRIVIHDAKALAASLAQVVSISAERSRSVRLEITEKVVRATVRNMEAGQAIMALSGLEVVATDGTVLNPAAYSFNGNYLLDALKLGEMFAFSLWGPNDPGRLDVLQSERGETLAVQMPLRT